MTNQVDWKNATKRPAPDPTGGRGPLTAVARFLARRAAERTMKTLKADGVAPRPRQGKGP